MSFHVSSQWKPSFRGLQPAPTRVEFSFQVLLRIRPQCYTPHNHVYMNVNIIIVGNNIERK